MGVMAKEKVEIEERRGLQANSGPMTCYRAHRRRARDDIRKTK